MNIKFLIVSMLLAILTIGAVSASDNLTAESDIVSLTDDSSGNNWIRHTMMIFT